MKSLLFIFCSLLLSRASYADGGKLWKKIDTEKKEKLLDAYIEFYEEYSAQQIEELAQLKPENIFELISSAYASSDMNCIYAGWPSKRVSGLCSTPIRYNPGYQAGECKSSELQCQPMLFGRGFCVPTNTRSQRSLAFNNCTEKFAQSGRTPRDVINEIEKSGKQDELFEVMSFAEKTCKSGAQASTGMCRKLLEVHAALAAEEVNANAAKEPIPPKKEVKETPPPAVKPPAPPLPPAPPTPPTPPTRKPDVIIEGKKETDTNVADDFINTVEEANRLNGQANNTGTLMCETTEPLSRTNPRANSVSIGTKHAGNFDQMYFKDRADTAYDLGVSLTMRGPNQFAPMVEGQPTTRLWNFISEDNAINATYINITDQPTPGTLSHLMETNIVLIPRKEKPRAETKGDEIHVTLPTGELVIFDAKTKLIKRGAFKEEAIDTAPNRFQRKFTTSYAGDGISIRTDRRGNDPRIGAGVVNISQKGKTCSLPKSEIWGGSVDNPQFNFADDNKLVVFLNSKCGSKFNL